ncbi:unnamed protein product [Lactuca saligna]|uniref:RRM domain-containing protein n=1 Tax=Lactuca saligna TaxID=75948 RepID=A0AA35ZVW7_LACSI|nr:unnamed protein product [Lactuca saligna]
MLTKVVTLEKLKLCIASTSLQLGWIRIDYLIYSSWEKGNQNALKGYERSKREGGDQSGGWTEVRRRNKTPQDTRTVVTTYYVSNLPDNVSKLKIMNSFQKFGKLVDIYIGGKRDRSGSIFAFVIFEVVRDVKRLEYEMGRIRCGHYILRVNVEKYQKQDTLENKDNTKIAAPQMIMKTDTWRPTNQSLSFVDVVRGTTVKHSANEVKHINIRPTGFSKCSHDYVMVNEAINIQIIGELPMILSLEGNHETAIHYIGGMNVILKFVNSKATKVFHENQHNWNRWFKWIKIRFNDDLIYERLTWVRILGLPIRFRSFGNYMKAANAFGKALDSSWTKSDVSFGNKKYKVGVVECDGDWLPFDNPSTTTEIHDTKVVDEDDEMYEDNCIEEDDYDDVNDSDEDGISATWEVPMHVKNIIQDGKIIKES